MASIISALFIVSICLYACYSLGVFDGDGVKRVEKRAYPTGEFVYSGEIRDGLFDGSGLIDFYNGESYIGDFTNGRLDGEGVFSTDNEEVGFWRFVGVFVNGVAESGTFYFLNGETIEYERAAGIGNASGQSWQYTGTFNMDNQHGTGTFIFNDGSVYSGSFSNGKASGEGTYTDPEGIMIYSGWFKNGMFDGQGRYFCSDGWSYEGEFKDGLFDGEGAYISETETVHGVWEKGVQIERYG